jgi:hypothetical protein
MKTSTYLFFCFIILKIASPAFAEVPLFKAETTIDKLPREFYDIDERLYERDTKRPYEVVIVLANDLGVGDDYGHTHEFKIVGVTKLKNGIRLRVTYSTDLYTEKIGEKNQDGLTPQNFLDENIGKFMADNVEAGRFYFWKAEAGWHQLSDVYTNNIFKGSAQQIFFHKIINPFIPQKQPLNESSGYGQRNGVIGGGSIGVQKNYKKDSLELHSQAEFGITKSSLPKSDSKHVSVSLESTYVIRPDLRASLILESQAKKHNLGTQITHSVNVNVQRKNWMVGAGVYLNKGTLDNHTLYNKPNSNGKVDPIYMFYGSYNFGRGSKEQTNILRPKEIIR